MMGRPGLMDILRQVGEVWEKDRGRLDGIGDKITEAIQPDFGAAPGGAPTGEILHKAFRQLSRRFGQTPPGLT
jgi:uncharacterized protein YyaL (SSP411 family)